MYMLLNHLTRTFDQDLYSGRQSSLTIQTVWLPNIRRANFLLLLCDFDSYVLRRVIAFGAVGCTDLVLVPYNIWVSPCIQSKLRSNNDSRQALEWRRSRHRLILSFMTHPADVVRIRSPRAGIVHPFKFDENGSFRKRENFACTRCVILCYILHEFPLLHMFAL